MTSNLLTLVAGYLLGSIPFGLLLTRAAGLGDVRNIGSGNIGATNVLRTGNKALAALTLLLDTLKGTAAVLLGFWIASRTSNGIVLQPNPGAGIDGFFTVFAAASNSISLAGLIGGFGAFLGHIFPVWLGFKGGKGVSTYIGILCGFAWKLALVFAIVWLATAALTRYSSLAALIATFIVFLILAATGGPFVTPIAAVLSALLFWKHRENIKRLIAGTESKIGAKA